MKSVFTAVLLLFLSFSFVRAQSPDEQYVRIYQLIQEADRLNDSGQSKAAAAKYVEAQENLSRFRGIYPGWNERVINYRLNYVTTKLAPLAAMLVREGTQPTITNALTTNVTAAVTDVPSIPPTNVIATSPAGTAVPISTELDNQIKALQTEVARLQADNRVLGAKLKEALSVQPAALDPREMAKAEERIRTLQKENELFKAQLTQRSNPSPAPALESQELTAKLNAQNELVTTLRAENEILKKHNVEWRQKYDMLFARINSQKQSTAPASAELESPRTLAATNLELQKQVELWKQVAHNAQRSQATPVTAGMPSDVRQELESLRARLHVLEAKPVPYTAEELALFEKSPASLSANLAVNSLRATETAPPAEGPLSKASRGIPPGAGALVRAAERAFSMANFAEAERKYSEVVRQDERNVTMLGNLASAQLELGRVAEAEKNVDRALQMDPNDYFALYLLGRIRFAQEKLDEAFVALSRSAQANPEYADTQNYLGIVLSEKGQRGAAEAALRKAVQIRPDHAVAHNNLAIVYATQKPPALALARWHYRKAMAAGHAKNTELEKLIGAVQ
jgi:tetratricopeptide (TPR) repeat protein